MSSSGEPLDFRYRSLQDILKTMGRVVVAFSGGVDSTLLLRVAKDVLDNDVLAVTAQSATMPRHEREDAVRFGREFEVEHLIVETHEMELDAFVKNPSDKCYICKKSRFESLIELAAKKGFSHVVDGGNLDDHKDYRPGMRAIRELGVRSPLSEAGLSKADIRLLSRKLNLATWNKPSYACLASRIPYHSPITEEKLRQVDEAEAFIRNLDLSVQVRVRHAGDTARIELDPEALPKIVYAPVRNRVVNYFTELGFKYITLDLEGYRMGSLNRVIQSAIKGN
jgi:uncharacterized protein